MNGFAPSLETTRAAGHRIVRNEYPAGVAGVKMSLHAIAQRIREGALDPEVQGVAFDALIKAGFNGRGSSAGTIRQRAAALLEFVRTNTLYAPDPPGVEYVKSAAAMLCLRPGLCVRGGDCDDQLILLGAMLMGVGLHVGVLKQTFGPTDQEHVLVECEDENGRWFPLDPSTDMPAGRKVQATEEFRLDPSNPSMIGLHGTPEAEFIGVGALTQDQLNAIYAQQAIASSAAGNAASQAAGPQTLPPSVPLAATPFVWSTTDTVLALMGAGVAIGVTVALVKRKKRRR